VKPRVKVYGLVIAFGSSIVSSTSVAEIGTAIAFVEIHLIAVRLPVESSHVLSLKPTADDERVAVPRSGGYASSSRADVEIRFAAVEKQTAVAVRVAFPEHQHRVRPLKICRKRIDAHGAVRQQKRSDLPLFALAAREVFAHS
jgi:hypothetical protein